MESTRGKKVENYHETDVENEFLVANSELFDLFLRLPQEVFLARKILLWHSSVDLAP